MTAATESQQQQAEAAGERVFTTRFRMLGLLPLAFFTAHFWFYAKNGGIDNMLWMCNIGNLLLAAGLFFGVPWMVRLAFIWAIPGLPLWLFEVVRNGGWLVTSFFTHIGALIVGLVAITRVRADKWMWLYGLGWYLLMQAASWLLTSPYWNVNVSHRIYGGYETVVSQYWQFWALSTLMVAAGLAIIGFILYKLFPPRRTA
jgi:hypothetical protein